MKRRDVLRTMGATAVLLPGSGCATLMNLIRSVMKEPTVEITKMSLKDLSLTSATAQFVAAITNPNPFGFDLAGLDYALTVQGARFASGNTKGGVKLKPRGKASTTFDVSFDLGKTAAAILDLIGKKVVDYKVDTTFHFDVPEVDPKIASQLPEGSIPDKFAIPASYAGTMPMPVLPGFVVKGFNVQNLSLNGVGFRVSSAVTNPNNFAIPIDGFGFDVKIGGRKVLGNKSVNGLNLAAKKSSNVAFDFDVDLVDIGLTALDLAKDPTLNWEVITKLASGKLNVPFNAKGSVKLNG